MRKLILGLGNPILSDDSIGFKVTEALENQMEGFDVKRSSQFGFNLLEILEGYDLCFIIDAIVTGESYGKIHVLSFEDARKTRHFLSSHELDLQSSLRMAEEAGYTLPRIVTLGVEVKSVEEFSENLSPELNALFPQIVKDVKEIILSLSR